MMADWLQAKLILLLAQAGPPGRRAQSMVEYSIIAALIAIVALAAVTTLGKDISGVLQDRRERGRGVATPAHNVRDVHQQWSP